MAFFNKTSLYTILLCLLLLVNGCAQLPLQKPIEHKSTPVSDSTIEKAATIPATEKNKKNKFKLEEDNDDMERVN